MMIVAKTKMKELPTSCKKCPFKKALAKDGCKARCGLDGHNCPTEKKGNGNIGYGLPAWCPLMKIRLIEQ